MKRELEYGSLIAILRGITAKEVIPVCSALIEQGWNAIEIPFQDESSLEAIALLCQEFGHHLPCGAGTVITTAQLDQLAQCPTLSLVVSPNTDEDLLKLALNQFPLVLPGVYSPTELIKAKQTGATHIKLFPASVGGIDLLQALKAIDSSSSHFFAVGGVGSKDFSAWLAAGVYGFGVGSELFKPGLSLQEIQARGKTIASARDRAMDEFKQEEPNRPCQTIN